MRSALFIFSIIILLFLAVIIFFEPVMDSTTIDYWPEYIDSSWAIYGFIFALIITAVILMALMFS